MKLFIEGIDYSNTLGPWIGKTFKMMDEYLESVLCDNNLQISKRQWLVLNFIRTNPGLNQNKLAHFVNRDKTSIARFVATLEKKEFVIKKASKEDKRVKTLFITDKAEALLAEATPIIREAVLKLQNEISEEEVKETIKSLKKIQEKIKHINNNE
jgi:DNA-binding MarR family transcriptional regulator